MVELCDQAVKGAVGTPLERPRSVHRLRWTESDHEQVIYTKDAHIFPRIQLIFTVSSRLLATTHMTDLGLEDMKLIHHLRSRCVGEGVLAIPQVDCQGLAKGGAEPAGMSLQTTNRPSWDSPSVRHDRANPCSSLVHMPLVGELRRIEPVKTEILSLPNRQPQPQPAEGAPFHVGTPMQLMRHGGDE